MACESNTNATQSLCEARRSGAPPTAILSGEIGDGNTRRQRVADYPALAVLRLTDDDLRELSHQGFVSREERGSLVFFKLRFRRERRQVVRYVRDAQHADSVRAELRRLRADRRMELELGRLTKCARRKLREGKRRLEPIVEAEGWKFHGRSLRRPRKARIQQ